MVGTERKHVSFPRFADSPSGSNLAHHVVYVHFPSTFETLLKEYYIYDEVAIVSAVGGALGLFLGFSCLSVMLSAIEAAFRIKKF